MNKKTILLWMVLATLVVIGLSGVLVLYSTPNIVQAATNETSNIPRLCPFVKLNQAIRLENIDQKGNGAFVAPDDVLYTQVKFNGFGAIINHVSYPDGNFNLNGVDCMQLPDKIGVTQLLDLSECVDELNDGINSFYNSPVRTFDIQVINSSFFEFDHVSDTNVTTQSRIVKAEHLDENRNFINDITQKVSELDGLWSEQIPEKHYVRVEFQNPLVNFNTYNTSFINVHPRFDFANNSQRIIIFEKNQDRFFGGKIPLENQNNSIHLFQMGIQNNTYVKEVLLEMEVRPAVC